MPDCAGQVNCEFWGKALRGGRSVWRKWRNGDCFPLILSPYGFKACLKQANRGCQSQVADIMCREFPRRKRHTTKRDGI